jgi:putative ABC transport system permease protein
MAFSLIHREASPAERAFLEGRGTVSAIASMRAMANAGEKGSGLVELKAVDGAYPTVGTLQTEPQLSTADLLANRDGAFGAAVDPTLLGAPRPQDRRAGAGGRSHRRTQGQPRFRARQDRHGVGFGPRLMISQEALRATGLLQPGSLVRWTYRLLLPAGPDADLERSRRGRPGPAEAGWEIRSRVNADPRFARNIERFTQFLTLVGLTALMVGGRRRRERGARLRRPQARLHRDPEEPRRARAAGGGALPRAGAAHRAVGIAIGLRSGAALPFAITAAFGHLLPIPIAPTLAPAELGVALLYGVLTALAFALAPLGRAHDVQVSGSFAIRSIPSGAGRGGATSSRSASRSRPSSALACSRPTTGASP